MANIYHQPWVLVPNQIRGKGGREIERFRGVKDGRGDYDAGSEAWIGSTTHVGNPPADNPYWGCSEVMLPDGRKEYLFKVLEENPEEILGEKHMAVNGTGIGVLIKYLDAASQYGLQCHPTREWAKKMWNSDHGKAESWYVISTRDDTAEPAYILLGFKEGVTREVWEKYYYEDNLAALENLCHKIQVKVGEAYFLGGGLPHALGEGCFVIEVQEPADITLGAHPWNKIPEKWREGVSEELYNERLLGAYVYDGCSYEENLKRWRSDKKLMREGEWGSERMVIGPDQTSYFSFSELVLNGKTELLKTGFPQVGIVTAGSGKLLWDGGEMEISKGMEIFFPYDIPELQAEGKLQLVLCNPEGAMA